MKISILGSEWDIIERTEDEDERLVGNDAFADWTTRQIVIEREFEGTLGDMEKYKRSVKRHEIVHAFLMECGLDENSGECASWARNETMVDWIARIGPKLLSAWSDAGALAKND